MSHVITIKIGKPVIHFLENSSEYFPDVSQFNFLRYRPSPGIQKKINKSSSRHARFFGESKWNFERQLINDFNRSALNRSKIEKLLEHDQDEPNRLIRVGKE